MTQALGMPTPSVEYGLLSPMLIILGVAVGLTNYMVGVQLPARLVEWVRAHIESGRHA